MDTSRIAFTSEKDVVPGGETSIARTMTHQTSQSFEVDVDPEVASSFEITGFISRPLPGGCGYHEEMASDVSIPAEAAAFTKHFDPWKTKSIADGGQIELKVKNVSDKPAVFRAALSERRTRLDAPHQDLSGVFPMHPLGMSRVRVLPGKITTLVATPDITFRGQHLVVFDRESFEVVSVRVGSRPQVEMQMPEKGRLLGENMRVYHGDFDTAAARQQITVKVQNVGKEPKVARVVLWGASASPSQMHFARSTRDVVTAPTMRPDGSVIQESDAGGKSE